VQKVCHRVTQMCSCFVNGDEEDAFFLEHGFPGDRIRPLGLWDMFEFGCYDWL